MAEPTIQIGGGNWAGKTDNLLGYYKEGERFYKQDFTFSRSTTGTYTDKDGYIQEMPYNKLTYSEDFSNASWVKSNVTIENSIYTSPLGYSQKIVGSNNTSLKLLYKNNIISPTKTISALVKAEGYNYAIIFIGGGGARVVFDLANGVVGNSIGTFDDASINPQGDGWYIISMSNPNVTSYASVTGSLSNSVYDRTGNGIDGIALAYIQVNEGTSAKTYFPTTTRLNMPRVDYLNNSNGSLILEPQRTNLITHSSDFSNAAWTKTGSSVVSGFTSPDGTTNAYKLVESSNNGQHTMFMRPSITNTNDYSFSFRVKKAERDVLVMELFNSSSAYAGVNFNLTSEIVTSSSGTGVATKITPLADNWYQCDLKGVANATTLGYAQISLAQSSYVGTSAESYQGDGSSGVYLFGAQLEQGSYPTTLINTSGSSVTRNQDTCSITNVADRIGQTEGVIFVDFKKEHNGVETWSINDGTSQNRVYIGFNGTNFISQVRSSGGAAQASFTTALINNTRYKCALAYKLNDFVLYINGVQIGSDNSGVVPLNMSNLAANASTNSDAPFFSPTNDVKLYNTRLSNSELATLTTL